MIAEHKLALATLRDKRFTPLLQRQLRRRNRTHGNNAAEMVAMCHRKAREGDRRFVELLDSRGDWLKHIAAEAAKPDVYFIAGEGTDLIKIGSSNDVRARLNDLQCGSPVPLRVIGIAKSGGVDLEYSLHSEFAGSRAHGEWFKVSAKLMERIAGLSA
jgi:hypothetical protein